MSALSDGGWVRSALQAINLFRIDTCELFTRLSVPECRRRLEDDLRSPTVDTRPLWSKLIGVSHPLDGAVTDVGFDLHKLYKAHSNGSWASVRGVFEEIPEGTRIHVRVGPSPNLRSTSLIVYALFSFIEVLLIYGVLFRSSSARGIHFGVTDPRILFGLLPFPLFMACASAASAASIRGEAKFVLGRLRECLDARSMA